MIDLAIVGSKEISAIQESVEGLKGKNKLTDHQDKNGHHPAHHSEKHHSAPERHAKTNHLEKHPQEGAKAHEQKGLRREKMSAQRAKSQKYLIFKTVVIGIIVLFASIIGLTLTSTNMFCGSCHEMDSDYVSWQGSSHRNVVCVQCHIGPGFFNLIVHKMASVKSLYYHITNDYEKPINADGGYAKELKDEYCLQCHEEVLATKTVKEARLAAIRPAHDKHKNLGLQCSSCHNRIAHEIKGYTDKSKMKVCLSCHQGSSSQANCNLCHSDKFLLDHNK